MSVDLKETVPVWINDNNEIQIDGTCNHLVIPATKEAAFQWFEFFMRALGEIDPPEDLEYLPGRYIYNDLEP